MREQCHPAEHKLPSHQPVTMLSRIGTNHRDGTTLTEGDSALIVQVFLRIRSL